MNWCEICTEKQGTMTSPPPQVAGSAMLMEKANKAIALQPPSQQMSNVDGREKREQAATGADSLGPGLLLSNLDHTVTVTIWEEHHTLIQKHLPMESKYSD